MERPVSQHITRIKEQIEMLESRSGTANGDIQRREIEMDIRELRLAVAHYELALQIEDSVLNKKR